MRQHLRTKGVCANRVSAVGPKVPSLSLNTEACNLSTLPLSPCPQVCAETLSSTGEEESATAAAAPHVAAVLLGIKLLVASFAASPGMRESLLREVQGKLVGVKEEVALPFVAVLGILVHRHPKAVLQHAILLKVGLCC